MQPGNLKGEDMAKETGIKVSNEVKKELDRIGLGLLPEILNDPNYKDRTDEIKAVIDEAVEAANIRERQAKIFTTLANVDVTPLVQLLKETGSDKPLKYLSWASALKLVKPLYPFMTWRVVEFTDTDGISRQYRYDPDTGNYTVFTEVTIEGITIGESLPIMDKNYAVRKQAYQVKTRFAEFWISGINGMLVNKAIRRCLVKNLASFGLGIDLYIGDDLPFAEEEEAAEPQTQQAQPPVEEKPAETSKKQANRGKTAKAKEVTTPVETPADQPETKADEAPANDPEPVAEVQSTKEEADPEKEAETVVMTLEEAMAHQFVNGGPNVKGKPVGIFVNESKSPEKSRKLLTLFAERGVDAGDKAACKAVLKALEEGTISFPTEA
jgi:hypothetical protein